MVATFTMGISGKRIMQIVGFVFPLIISAFLLFINKSLFKRIKVFVSILTLYIICIFLILIRIGFDYQLMTQYLFEGFTSSDPMSSNVRVEQFYALLDGWILNPIFGAGSGAVQWAYIRSFEDPWNYELSYMKLLFDFGLFGILIYGIGVLWIWYKSVRMYLGNYELGKYALAVSIGSISFMVGNATNPFLLKFDYLVVIFLPIALINLWLVKRRFIKPTFGRTIPYLILVHWYTSILNNKLCITINV